MNSFRATFFDGVSSSAHPAVVRSDGLDLYLELPNAESLRVPLREVRVLPPLGTTQRVLLFPGGGRCETTEHAAVEAVFAGTRRLNAGRWVSALESHWRTVALSVAGLVAAVWVFAVFGIPYAAELVAKATPSGVLDVISEQTGATLDRHIFKPSQLAPARRSEVTEVFQEVQRDLATGSYGYRLALRKAPSIGPNAFAMPSGVVFVTDELVALAVDERELAGVLAHEIAHVEGRHGLRNVLQDAGVFLLISAVLGDVASITSVAATLPAMLMERGYSRKFEHEADAVAGRYLLEKGWGVGPYQAILQRMAQEGPKGGATTFLSTHPGVEERIGRLGKLQP